MEHFFMILLLHFVRAPFFYTTWKIAHQRIYAYNKICVQVHTYVYANKRNIKIERWIDLVVVLCFLFCFLLLVLLWSQPAPEKKERKKNYQTLHVFNSDGVQWVLCSAVCNVISREKNVGDIVRFFSQSIVCCSWFRFLRCFRFFFLFFCDQLLLR